jgi:hypothetical protein
VVSLLMLELTSQSQPLTFPLIERLAIDHLDPLLQCGAEAVFRLTALKYRINTLFLSLFPEVRDP